MKEKKAMRRSRKHVVAAENSRLNIDRPMSLHGDPALMPACPRRGITTFQHGFCNPGYSPFAHIVMNKPGIDVLA